MQKLMEMGNLFRIRGMEKGNKGIDEGYGLCLGQSSKSIQLLLHGNGVKKGAFSILMNE